MKSIYLETVEGWQSSSDEGWCWRNASCVSTCSHKSTGKCFATVQGLGAMAGRTEPSQWNSVSKVEVIRTDMSSTMDNGLNGGRSTEREDVGGWIRSGISGSGMHHIQIHFLALIRKSTLIHCICWVFAPGEGGKCPLTLRTLSADMEVSFPAAMKAEFNLHMLAQLCGG